MNVLREEVKIFLKSNNVQTADETEKLFYDFCVDHHKMFAGKVTLEDFYMNTFYDMSANISENFELFISDINEGKLSWQSKTFNKFREEVDNDIEQEVAQPEIEAGDIKCIKCQSLRVYVYQLQLRSSDEGATNINTCSKCGTRWTTNN